MSFQAYRVSKYEHTHENMFFRTLCEKLDKKYGADDNLHILIGNLSCNGRSLDAVFLKDKNITVLEFKNYDGELVFSENNQWVMHHSNGRISIVHGGNGNRNPFAQVKAYRNSLIDYIQTLGTGVGVVPGSIDLRRIGAVVVFAKDVTLRNPEQLPGAAPFFHLTDHRGIISVLEDMSDEKLRLNDNNLMRIAEGLGVSESMRYHAKADAPDDQDTRDSLQAMQLAHIESLLSQADGHEQINSAGLKYYHLMLQLESYKDSGIESPVALACDMSEDGIEIPWARNAVLVQRLHANRQENYPKEVTYGIRMKVGAEKVIVATTTYAATEILMDQTVQKINMRDFDLYGRDLLQKGLSDDVLVELEENFNSRQTLDDRMQVLFQTMNLTYDRSEIDVVGGTCSKNLTSIHSQRELSSMETRNQLHDVLSALLDGNPVSNGGVAHDTPMLYQITPLDDSQKAALMASLSNPLTVITGPPGTGKSQLVLNLIANVLMRGQTMLFASKMNKAVDTVVERFREAVGNEYMLRFGSKNDIRSNLIPTLQRIQGRPTAVDPHHKMIADASAKELKTVHDDLVHIQESLKRLQELPGAIEKSDVQLKNIQRQHNDWKRLQDDTLLNIAIEGGELPVAENEILERLKYDLSRAACSGFGRLIFALFKRRRTYLAVQKLQYDLIPSLQKYLKQERHWLDSPTADVFLMLECVTAVQTIRDTLSMLRERLTQHGQDLKVEEDHRRTLQEELDRLLTCERELLTRRDTQESKYIQLNREVLQYKVEQAMASRNTHVVADVINYLQNDAPQHRQARLNYFNAIQSFITTFGALAVTNLSVRNAFPLQSNLVDYIVVDEASQCDVASALPLLQRGGRIIVLGDPLQLRHVTQVRRHEDRYMRERLNLRTHIPSFVEKSLYDVLEELSHRSGIATYALRTHYRCHPDIIEFSREYYYRRQLHIDLDVVTRLGALRAAEKGIYWIDVVGLMHQRMNINEQEVRECVRLAHDIRNAEPDVSIGITTPFRHQADALQREATRRRLHNVTVDTVHRFQGDERDVMILSLAVTSGANETLVRFINEHSRELLNVAITRARSSLYIVGNRQYCESVRVHPSHINLLQKLASYTSTLPYRRSRYAIYN